MISYCMVSKYEASCSRGHVLQSCLNPIKTILGRSFPIPAHCPRIRAPSSKVEDSINV